MTSSMHDDDLERAVDIVFVAEGFTQDALPAYRAAVDELVSGLESDRRGFVALHPDRFNYHRVDIVSATDGVTNAARDDTALGVCFERWEELRGPEQWQPTVEPALVELASRNAPDVDVVVVVIRSDLGGANAMPQYGSAETVSFVNLPIWYSAGVLTHELGHAIFGLGDEYTLVDECYPAPAFYSDDPLFEPNLGLDPGGAKWRDIIDGARPGGSGYARCIFHPTDRCRMNANSDDLPFCPVCQAHIETMLRARSEPAWNDGPPRCGFTLPQAPDEASGQLLASVFGVDPNGLAAVELSLDGAPLVNPAGMSLPSTCLFSGEWACSSILLIDTLPLEPGEHLLELRCADRLGLESRDSVVLDVHH